MQDTDDITLLREWALRRSETAFRAVVGRYAGLVFGVALRRTGEHSLAEEAVQNVFTDLAKKAAVVVERQRPLAAWLHRCAVYESATLLRSEIRQRNKMKRLADIFPDESPPDPWEEIRPLLDEASNALSESDRRVLLLHWFERRKFADIAHITGSTTAAVQRRGLRALDKLAALIRRRGLVVPATVLAAGLAPQLSHAAPAGLAATVSTTAIHAAPAAGGLTLFLQQSLYVMSSAKLTTAAIVLAAAAIPVSVQYAASHSSYGTQKAYAKDGAVGSKGKRPPAPTVTAAPDLSLVKQAINRLLTNPEDYQTQLELRRLMFALSAEEIPGMLELLMMVPGKQKESLYDVCHALFARWAELDPAAAAQAALAVPKSSYGFYPLRGAFITWAAADIDMAWAWLEKSPTDSMNREFLGGEALASLVTDAQSGVAMIGRADAVQDKAWRDKLRYWVVRAWTRTELTSAAVDWAAGLSDETERTEWLGKTVELAGEASPLNGLAQVHRIDNAERRKEVTHNILWPWLLNEPDKDFAEMERHTADWDPDHFRFAGDALTRHDAANALAAARRLPEGGVRDNFINGMMTGVLYNNDSAAMLPALGMISEDYLYSQGGLVSYVEILTKQNPHAAAEWLVSLPEDSQTRRLGESQVEANAGFDAAVIRLAKNNPVFAMKLMDGQMRSDFTDGNVSRDGLGVDGIRRGVFREWLKIDAKAVLAYVNAKASVWSRGSDLSTLMQEWSSIAAAAAAGALKKLPESGSAFAGKGHAEAVMRGWYAKDPAAANRWAQTLDDPALRESLNTLAAELAATDPAAKAAVLLAAPQRDGHGLATALGEWLTGDPTAALTKLSALPAGDKFWANHAADTAQRWAMSSRNGTTPEQFLESISAVPAGAQREAMIKGLASYGASNDIPFAVRMVAEMGEGRARDEAIGMLTELWMRKDPVKTSEWLATLPADSGSRHSGVARFAESLAADDPERAAVWAATLPDSFWQKEGVMKTVLEKWRAKDPAAAEAWAGGK